MSIETSTRIKFNNLTWLLSSDYKDIRLNSLISLPFQNLIPSRVYYAKKDVANCGRYGQKTEGS